MSTNIDTAIRELLDAKVSYGLRRALRKQPVQALRLMLEVVREAAAPSPPLTEEEADRRVIGLLRALGEERLNRLLAKAREGS